MIVYWFIEIISTFVEIFMSIIFCSIVFRDVKINKSKCFLYSIIPVIMVILLNHIQLTSKINTVIIIIIDFISVFLFYRKSILKIGISVLIYFGLLILSDILVGGLISSFTDITISDISDVFSPVRIIAILLSKTILISFVLIIIRFSKGEKIWTRNVNLLLALSTVFAVIVTSILFFFQIDENNNISISLVIIYFIILMMLYGFYFLSVHFAKTEYQKQQLMFLEQHNEMLEKTIKEQKTTFDLWKKDIHDYKNTIIALDDMLENNEISELHEYIKSKTAFFKDKAFFVQTGNSTVDIILNSKIILAQANDIIVTFNVKISENLSVPSLKLSILLGNLIDNAIEALKEENEKYLHIQIKEIQSLLIIEISNVCTKKIISAVTTKEKKVFHGIGLRSVRDIVDEYDGGFSLKIENGFAKAVASLKI